jgi:hypothetical protein
LVQVPSQASLMPLSEAAQRRLALFVRGRNVCLRAAVHAAQQAHGGTLMVNSVKIIGALTVYQGAAIEGREGETARIVQVLRDHLPPAHRGNPEHYIASDEVLARLGGVKSTDRLDVVFVDSAGRTTGPNHYDLAAVDFEMFAHLRECPGPAESAPARQHAEDRGHRRPPEIDYEVDDVVVCKVDGRGLRAGNLYLIHAVSRRRVWNFMRTTLVVNVDFKLVEIVDPEPVLRRTRIEATRKVPGGHDTFHSFRDVGELDEWRAQNDIPLAALYGLRYVELG